MNTLFNAFKGLKRRTSPGWDGVTMEEFSNKLEENLKKLSQELKEKTYIPHPVLVFSKKKKKGEHRRLAVLTIRDKVVQRGWSELVSPYLNAKLSRRSFAFKPERSILDVGEEIKKRLDEGFGYIVKVDIQNYFGSIQHDKLQSLLKELLPDRDLVHLVELWLKAKVVEGASFLLITQGLLQGAIISPLLSNLYLDPLDKKWESQGIPFFRYADDLLFMAKGRDEAHKLFNQVRRDLALWGLTISPDKSGIRSVEEGFQFLGMNFTTQEDPWDFPPQEKRELGKTEGQSPKPISHQRPLLRTLYLTEPGSVLKKEGDSFLIEVQGQKVSAIPHTAIDQIIVFGPITLTTPVIQYCLKREIPITFLSNSGNYFGRLDATVPRNLELLELQFIKSKEEGFALSFVKEIVTGKLRNSKVLLQRRDRRRKEGALEESIEKLGKLTEAAKNCNDIEKLRGYEGVGAAIYFESWEALLPEGWVFPGRRKRPPPDPVNAMLSLGYTILLYNIYSLLLTEGLSPYLGIFHTPSERHPALASDLIEEWRYMVETLVLQLINSRMITLGDFRMFEGNKCLMSDRGRYIFLKALDNKLKSTLTHSPSGRVMSYREAIQAQVRQFVKVLKGEKARYDTVRFK